MLLFGTLVGGLIGLIVCDRWPIVALLIYVPLVPLGLTAVIWELAARGSGLSKLRWVLGATGLLSLACGALAMSGTRHPQPLIDSSADPAPWVLQWNVRWGGGGHGADGEQESWDSICRDIARQAPGIVILSESPGRERIAHLERMLGAEWTSVVSQSERPARYLYRLVVLSRWPVTLERETAIPTGRLMQARVAAPGGDVRVLVVDGESHPWLDRVPRLRAVARFCRDAEAASQPIDIIAGDFNAVGQSIGFDAIADAGFSAKQPGWRATWPSICPIYDIDHLWVGTRLAVLELVRFTNLATDHRGQVARLVRQSRPTTRFTALGAR
jgi:endonuclease/exonuclease/phosphatase family metal-dependent hydrolase